MCVLLGGAVGHDSRLIGSLSFWCFYAQAGRVYHSQLSMDSLSSRRQCCPCPRRSEPSEVRLRVCVADCDRPRILHVCPFMSLFRFARCRLQVRCRAGHDHRQVRPDVTFLHVQFSSGLLFVALIFAIRGFTAVSLFFCACHMCLPDSRPFLLARIFLPLRAKATAVIPACAWERALFPL